MPTLPALPNIPQAQYDRIVAAFPGNTLAEKAQAYQDWSINNLIDEVERAETRKLDETATAARAAQLQTLRDSLPPRRTWPPA